MENKTAEEYLKKIGIEDRVLNREDLPEYWKSISQILYEYASQQLAEKDKEIERLKLSQIRQPLIWFADKMEEKLKKNDHKGGWDNCEIGWLIKRLEEETEELKNHYWKFTHENGRSAGEGFIIPSETVDIINECADVANFAMMIANKIESLNK